MTHQYEYVQPGEILVLKEPKELTTILGSCVSICLWDEKKGIGGMNHFLFPYFDNTDAEPGKYGDSSTRELLKELQKKGSKLENLTAKIFGGAKMTASNLSIFNTGELNISAAKATLGKLKIKIESEDIGGKSGRKIEFNTSSGTVKVTYLKNQES